MNLRNSPGSNSAPNRLLLITLLLLLVPTCGKAQNIKLSSQEELQRDLLAVPCKSNQRLPAARSLFEQAGAQAADIRLDEFKNAENLVVTKIGESSEKIVVGAHYDKVADGCGALDNWTGVVTLAHLFNSLRDLHLRKTVVFVAFDKEEKGLLGSHAMIGPVSKEQALEFCAMINVDTLGLAPPQVATNMSSKKLAQFTEDLAREMKISFSRTTIQGADSDSSSFLAKKIPAVTILGLNNNWPRILHGPNDQVGRINAQNVYNGYRLVLAMIVRLDQLPCDANR